MRDLESLISLIWLRSASGMALIGGGAGSWSATRASCAAPATQNVPIIIRSFKLCSMERSIELTFILLLLTAGVTRHGPVASQSGWFTACALRPVRV